MDPAERGSDDFRPDRTIDATGLVVCPGLVDLSARLREPGSEYRATLESEIDAALAGGVTSLVCPPDTDPPLDEPGLVEMLKHRARTLNRTHVHPLGALTVGLAGVALTEMSELRDAGCVGFSQANAPIADTQVLLRALQYAQTFGFTVWLRPQDAHLGRGGVAASGPVAARLGLSVGARDERDRRAADDLRAAARVRSRRRAARPPVPPVVGRRHRARARGARRRACRSPATSASITCT